GVTGGCTYVTNWMSPLRRGHPRFMTIEGTNGFVITGDAGQDMLRRVVKGEPLTYPVHVKTRRADESDVPARFYYDDSLDLEFASPFADVVLPDADPQSVCDGIARAEELRALHESVTQGKP